MVQISTMPSCQQMRQQLTSPQVRTLTRPGGPLHPVLYRSIAGIATAPFLNLWEADRPSDPALLVVLQPVADAVAEFSPHEELLPQWDRLLAVVEMARLTLDAEPSKPTVDEVIAEVLSALRTNLLISSIGRVGATQLLTTELTRHYGSLLKPNPLPLRYFDLAASDFVDRECTTTLSLAGIKYFANRDNPQTDASLESLPRTLPAVAKQFAAQSIIGFFTDWDEHYRGALADAHGCSPKDFQINYFGDLKNIRHDFVHNRGTCKKSAGNRILKWFCRGEFMIPTSQHFAELVTEFPAAELCQKPTPRVASTTTMSIPASIPIVREFEKLANQTGEPPRAALEAALSEWIERNRPSDKP